MGCNRQGRVARLAVLVTRRASEKPPVKNYPKKQGRRSEPEVDADVCIVDIWDSLTSRT